MGYPKTAAAARGLAIGAWMVAAACQRQDLSSSLQARTDAVSREEQLDLAPGRCARGGDASIYVSLGDVVLGVPRTDTPVARYPAHADVDKLPVPPTPNAPEGCREHPSPAQVLHLTRYQAGFLAQAFPEDDAPLASINVNWLPRGRSLLQDSNEELSERMSKRRQCIDVAAALSGCGKDPANAPSVYRARTEAHALPDGRPWVVVCGMGPNVSPDDCQVSYRLPGGIGLNYRFDRQRVPVSRMIDLDRAVRAGVLALRVTDYPWSREAAAN